MLITLITLNRGPRESAKEPPGFGELFLDFVVNFLGDRIGDLHDGTAKVLHLDIGAVGGALLANPSLARIWLSTAWISALSSR